MIHITECLTESRAGYDANITVGLEKVKKGTLLDLAGLITSMLMKSDLKE